MNKLNTLNSAIVFISPLTPKKMSFAFRFTIVTALILCSNIANSQSINVIDNPDGGSAEVNTIVYNTQLYTQYMDSAGKEHLAKWNGTQLTLIDNPDNGQGVAGYEIVYNNKLCVRYQNQSGKYQLAQYDGDSLTLVANPDNGNGFNANYETYPVIFNNKLFITYVSATSHSSMAVFDGTTLSIISPPNSLLEYIGEGIVYNSKLVSVWLTSSAWQLAEFDGTNFNILSNPDQGTGFEYSAIDAQVPVQPIIYNDKIIFRYKNNQGVFQLAQYDGVNVSLISNPTGTGQLSFAFNPIIYNSKLYTSFDSASSKKLVEFDGQNLHVIPFTGSNTLLPIPYFSTYNNKLYFLEQSANNQNHLASFDGTSTSVVPDLSVKNFESTVFETYRNNLFFGYGDIYTQSFLSQYDGNNISIVNNPDSGIGYQGSPVVLNDTLFFVYQNANGVNHLAFLNETTLAVSFLHFTAELQNNNALLQWQTPAEQNTSYFKILRSADGRNFSYIKNVPGAATSGTLKNYSYVDANVTNLNVSKLYYRLQEVDKSGKIIYSDIETININAHQKFFVSPNPTKNFVNIVSSNTVNDAQIRITDLNGKTLYTVKQNFVAGQQLKIDISQFSKQVLLLTIDANNVHELFKVISE